MLHGCHGETISLSITLHIHHLCESISTSGDRQNHSVSNCLALLLNSSFHCVSLTLHIFHFQSHYMYIPLSLLKILTVWMNISSLILIWTNHFRLSMYISWWTHLSFFPFLQNETEYNHKQQWG